MGSPLNEELDLVRYPPLVGRSLGGRMRSGSGSTGGRSVSSPMPFSSGGGGVVDSPVEENPSGRDRDRHDGLGDAF